MGAPIDSSPNVVNNLLEPTAVKKSDSAGKLNARAVTNGNISPDVAVTMAKVNDNRDHLSVPSAPENNIPLPEGHTFDPDFEFSSPPPDNIDDSAYGSEQNTESSIENEGKEQITEDTQKITTGIHEESEATTIKEEVKEKTEIVEQKSDEVTQKEQTAHEQVDKSAKREQLIVDSTNEGIGTIRSRFANVYFKAPEGTKPSLSLLEYIRENKPSLEQLQKFHDDGLLVDSKNIRISDKEFKKLTASYGMLLQDLYADEKKQEEAKEKEDKEKADKSTHDRQVRSTSNRKGIRKDAEDLKQEELKAEENKEYNQVETELFENTLQDGVETNIIIGARAGRLAEVSKSYSDVVDQLPKHKWPEDKGAQIATQIGGRSAPIDQPIDESKPSVSNENIIIGPRAGKLAEVSRYGITEASVIDSLPQQDKTAQAEIVRELGQVSSLQIGQPRKHAKFSYHWKAIPTVVKRILGF